MLFINNYVNYLRFFNKTKYTLLPIERNQELFNSDVLDFAYRNLAMLINQESNMLTKIFSEGNSFLNSISKPIHEYYLNTKQTLKDKFLLTYTPKKSLFYFVPLNSEYMETNKELTILAKTVSNKSLSSNAGLLVIPELVYKNELDNLINTIPTRLEIKITDITNAITIDTDTNYFINTTTFTGTEYNTNLSFIYPSRIFITINNGINFKPNNYICKVYVTGQLLNGNEYTETLEFLSNTTLSTSMEYISIKQIKIIHIEPNNITVDIDTSYTIQDKLIDLKSYYFADRYMENYSIWAKFNTQNNGSVDYTTIEFYTYAAVNSQTEAVLAGKSELELQFTAVPNYIYSDLLDLYNFNLKTIDQDRNLLYTLDDNYILSIYDLRIPFPNKDLLKIMKPQKETWISLYIDRQFPAINETIQIKPTQLLFKKAIKGLVLYVHYLDNNGNIVKTEIDRLELSSPKMKLPNKYFEFTIDEPGLYIFEIEAIYEDNEKYYNWLPLYIPLLKPLTKFDLKDYIDESVTTLTKIFVSKDGKLILLDDQLTKLYEINFNVDRYFIDFDNNRLIFPEKYNTLEIQQWD